MSERIDAVLTVGANLEWENAMNQIKMFKKEVEGEEFSIKAGIPKDALNVDAAKKALESILVKAEEVQKVVASTRMVEVDGKQYEEVTRYMVEYLDKAGKIRTTTVEVANAFDQNKEASKAYGSMLDKAQKAVNNSTNVEKKHKDAIQDTASRLTEAITQWRELADKHQTNTDKARDLQDKIDKLNKELDENVAKTKTTANATQDFTIRMANAIKQSFAYTLAMRAMREAQQSVGDAIRYAVDLDKEMTNIKLLQTEGAKTTAEIERLADSYNRLGKEMGASTVEVAKGAVEWLNL